MKHGSHECRGIAVTLRSLLVAILLASFAGVAFAQSLSQHAMDQISALMEEKASRTPAQKKMSSQLIFADKMDRKQPIARGVDKLDVKIKKDKGNRALVDITLNSVPSNGLLNAITKMGG